MVRDVRRIPPTKLTGKWKKQDVNGIVDLEQHGVRLPNDFTDWSKLSGEVKVSYLSEEELAAYNAKK